MGGGGIKEVNSVTTQSKPVPFSLVPPSYSIGMMRVNTGWGFDQATVLIVLPSS